MSEQSNQTRAAEAAGVSIVDRTSEIVQSYLNKTDVTAEDLPRLIERIGAALSRIDQGQAGVAAPADAWEPQTASEPASHDAAPAPASTGASTGAQVGAPAAAQTEAPLASNESDRPSWMPEGTFGPQRAPDNPAVPIDQSHTDDYIWCLEDGRRMQMLKRHLKTKYGMSEDQYRRKWGLPSSYPMTAKNYRMVRRQLAQRTGFQPIEQTDAQAQAAVANESAAPAASPAASSAKTRSSSKTQGAKAQSAKAQGTKAQGTKAQGGKAESGKTQGGTKAAGGKSSGAQATAATSGGKTSGAKATGTKATGTKATGSKSASSKSTGRKSKAA